MVDIVPLPAFSAVFLFFEPLGRPGLRFCGSCWC